MLRPEEKRGQRFIWTVIQLIAIAMIAVGPIVKLVRPKPVYAEVDLHALGSFPLDAWSGSIADIPPRFRALDGKKVSVEGFMCSPLGSNSNVSEFQIVYTGFTAGSFNEPQVQERIFAHDAHPGRLFDVPVEVKGVIHVNVKQDPKEGRITSVYEMDVDSVTDLDDPKARAVVFARDSMFAGFEPYLLPVGWILLAIVGLREILLIIRRIPSRSAVRRNICSICGYDIRANPERCPECATPTGLTPVNSNLLEN